MSHVDPFGLSPGDHYPTANAAALAAIGDILGQSIAEDTEYAGVIYYEDGYYSYTSPNKGSKDESWPGSAPWRGSETGMYHTHGGCDPGYDNENFSPTDMDNADANGQPSYLGTPSGDVKKYTPYDRSDVQTIGHVNTNPPTSPYNGNVFNQILDYFGY